MVRTTIKAKGEQLAIASAQKLPPAIAAALVAGLSRGLQIASGIAQREYLSGPRPARLGTRTGRLHKSIATLVQDDGKRIVGRMGSNLRYAAFHEHDFHGTVRVRAHTRVSRAFNLKTGETVEPRRALRDQQGNFIGWKESLGRAVARQRKTTGMQQVTVKAHQRRIDYRGRPFLLPALRQATPQIQREIENELARVKTA